MDEQEMVRREEEDEEEEEDWIGNGRANDVEGKGSVQDWEWGEGGGV